jgi:cobyrinic acid a,c-diamide synthase
MHVRLEGYPELHANGLEVNNSLRLENPSLECELVEADCGDLVFMSESFWTNYPQNGQAKSENNVDIEFAAQSVDSARSFRDE